MLCANTTREVLILLDIFQRFEQFKKKNNQQALNTIFIDKLKNWKFCTQKDLFIAEFVSQNFFVKF